MVWDDDFDALTEHMPKNCVVMLQVNKTKSHQSFGIIKFQGRRNIKWRRAGIKWVGAKRIEDATVVDTQQAIVGIALSSTRLDNIPTHSLVTAWNSVLKRCRNYDENLWFLPVHVEIDSPTPLGSHQIDWTGACQVNPNGVFFERLLRDRELKQYHRKPLEEI